MIVGVVPESPIDETQVYEEEGELDDDTKKQLACQPTQAYGAADDDGDTTDDGKIERQI